MLSYLLRKQEEKLRTFQFNKNYFKNKAKKNKHNRYPKIELPIKSLEINLGDRIRAEHAHYIILLDIVRFMNRYISDEDKALLSKFKPLTATLLNVHGNKHKKFKWRFMDNQRARSILRWIREKDGKFDLIVIMACNPGKCSKTVRTKKSFLVMSTKILYMRDTERSRVILVKPKNSKRPIK